MTFDSACNAQLGRIEPPASRSLRRPNSHPIAPVNRVNAIATPQPRAEPNSSPCRPPKATAWTVLPTPNPHARISVLPRRPPQGDADSPGAGEGCRVALGVEGAAPPGYSRERHSWAFGHTMVNGRRPELLRVGRTPSRPNAVARGRCTAESSRPTSWIGPTPRSSTRAKVSSRVRYAVTGRDGPTGPRSGSARWPRVGEPCPRGCVERRS